MGVRQRYLVALLGLALTLVVVVLERQGRIHALLRLGLFGPLLLMLLGWLQAREKT